jgi:hypothetical protein
MPDKSPVIWAYTYRLDPPQFASRLRSVRSVLAGEHAAARERAGMWEGRLVTDDRVSHILILSDSPDLTGEANQRLELALRALDATYVLTVPMIVPVGRDESIPPKE